MAPLTITYNYKEAKEKIGALRSYELETRNYYSNTSSTREWICGYSHVSWDLNSTNPNSIGRHPAATTAEQNNNKIVQQAIYDSYQNVQCAINDALDIAIPTNPFCKLVGNQIGTISGRFLVWNGHSEQ